MLIAVILILIHYSMVVSKMSDQIKTLVQEQGLLKMEIDRLRAQKDQYGDQHNPVKKGKRPVAG